MPTSLLLGSFFSSLLGILIIFFGKHRQLRKAQEAHIQEAILKSMPQESIFERRARGEKMEDILKEGNSAEKIPEEDIPEEDLSRWKKFLLWWKRTPKIIEETPLETPETEAEKKKKAKEVLQREPSKVRPKEFSDLIKKAEVCLARDEYEEAERLYIKILSFDSRNTTAIQKLAFLYLKTGSPQKAETLYRDLLETTPQTPALYTNLGLSFFQQQKYPEAIEAYAKAIDLDRDHAERYSNLGKVYFIMGEYEPAVASFEEAVRRESRNLSFLYLLADCHLEAKNFPEAKKWYSKILDLSPYDEAAKEEIERLKALGF